MKTAIPQRVTTPGATAESSKKKKTTQEASQKSSAQKRRNVPSFQFLDKLSSGSSQATVVPKQSVLKLQKMGISRPQKTQQTNDEALLKTVNISKAQKFWGVNRPYFFAVEKSNVRSPKAIDLKSIQKRLENHDNYPEIIDKDYHVYFIKSTETSIIHQLPSVTSLTNLGTPSIPLKSLWRLNDDDQNDPDNIWIFASRVTLSILFKYENNAIKCDKNYAAHLTETISNNQYRYALSKLLYLASYEDKTTFLQMLINEGADPNSHIGNYDNKTALAVTIKYRNFAAAELLLKAHADPNYSPDGITRSGWDAARETQSKEAFDLLNKYRSER